VHLATIFGGVKTHLGSIALIKYYSAIYLAIGGQEGMDGGGRLWMT
jgi:hypothetical protein